jgi:hypothetical protein
VSAKPKIKSLVVVAVAVEDQLVTEVVWLFTGPQTSRAAVDVIPEYSPTIARDGLLGVTLIPVIPLGTLTR